MFPTPTPQPLGQVLKKRRKELGLTLAQMGDRLGLRNGNFIGMVERAERMPSDDKLVEMATILGLRTRDLVALKYQEAGSSAVSNLLGPVPPALPRMRNMLLATCENREIMKAEFALGEHTAVERMIFDAVLEFALLPELRRDRGAPTALRKRLHGLEKQLRRDPTLSIDPWWFEEEAEDFVPWARRQFMSWSFDTPTLVLRIRHSASAGDVSTLPLLNPELRSRMLASIEVSPPPLRTAAPASLADVLAAEGLGEDDVEEVLAMVEIKKRRAARRSTA